MPTQPFSAEELQAIQSIALWMKIQNAGTLMVLITVLWKAFKVYSRLQTVEKAVTSFNPTSFITWEQHSKLQEECRFRVTSEIDNKDNALHLKVLSEVSELKEDISTVRETQCHMLGKLEQIGDILKKEMK